MASSILKGIREKDIFNFFKRLRDEGYTKCLLDGNLLLSLETSIMKSSKIHSLEETDGWSTRRREGMMHLKWHGWLHHITDHTGDELLMLKPRRYGLEHRENLLSGEADEHANRSKGHVPQPGQRDWSRYEPWQATGK